MLLHVLYGLAVIALWEFCKAVKNEWVKQEEIRNGKRWICPDCTRVEFHCNNPEVLMHMIVDHDTKFHPEKEVNDAQG